MKNDKLFDMLEEFKVDDEYIEEALTGGSDSRGIKVYAGKTRPMKIIAPIAACLAVFAAAGIAFANRDRLPINNSVLSPASASEDSENSNWESDPNTEPWKWRFPSQTEYADMCKEIVTNTYADKLQGDITWQENDMDIDIDGIYELLLCPQINGRSVNGVGVCVFKKYSVDSYPEYIGSFGRDFDTMDIDNIDIITKKDTGISYYFGSYEDREKCIDSVQKISFDNGKVRDESYLRLVKTYPDSASSDTQYTETAYRYGEAISTEQLLSEWNDVRNTEFGDILPAPNTSSDAHLGKSECVQLLIDKYNVHVSANSLHRVIQYIDINNDGDDETVIEFRNCEQLRGLYVFSSDGKLIGEFDLKGERCLTGGGVGTADIANQRFNRGIFLYDRSGERYYWFETHRTGHLIENGEHWWLEVEINKIVVNEDGTLGSVKAAEANYKVDNEWFKINGKEVSQDEFRKEEDKYGIFSSQLGDPYIW